MSVGLIVFQLWALTMSPNEASALASWDPRDLTDEQAAEHLAAARTAADATGQDPYLLLYVAWHESRFTSGVRTHEIGGKISCGVMTPVPGYHCRSGSLQDQYMAGAQHLKDWAQACDGDSRCQLLGYAGGYALIRACRHRTHIWRWRYKHRRIDLCGTADLYLNGAAELRSRIEATSGST